MSEIRILVADDDKDISGLLTRYLEIEGYKVDSALDGQEAIVFFNNNKYELIILDIMMPKKSGIDVCKYIREKSNVPVIMLTAKGDDIDKVLGLGVGADDYITKPFSIHEVMARVKSQLRRFLVLGSDLKDKSNLLEFNSLRIDIDSCEVYKEGSLINLTAKEYEILKFLASNPNRVYTKKQIFAQVWDDDYLEDDNTVMVHIRRLRKKIEDNPNDPKYILTVWGIGYKFIGVRDNG